MDPLRAPLCIGYPKVESDELATIDIRMTRDESKRIKRAAHSEGMSVEGFIMRAASRYAERLIEAYTLLDIKGK